MHRAGGRAGGRGRGLPICAQIIASIREAGINQVRGAPAAVFCNGSMVLGAGVGFARARSRAGGDAISQLYIIGGDGTHRGALELVKGLAEAVGPPPPQRPPPRCRAHACRATF